MFSLRLKNVYNNLCIIRPIIASSKCLSLSSKLAAIPLELEAVFIMVMYTNMFVHKCVFFIRKNQHHGMTPNHFQKYQVRIPYYYSYSALFQVYAIIKI